MNFETITLASAFLGGLLSFFSPCTFPLLPSLITFFESDDSRQGRMNFGKLFFFWLGFTLVFLAMGSIASALGMFFYDYRSIIIKAGGIFVIIMGLFLLGVGSRTILQREHRPFLSRHFEGYGGAFLFGVAFTAGWTPCSGPILASILMVAGNSENPTAGTALLGAYAIGFGVPFGILTFFFDRLFHRIRGLSKYLPWIQKITGILLIILGVLIYQDILGAWILQFGFTQF